GGAAGGGYSQVVPMEDINLHFTGDFAAIALANNLLAALIDNHIYQGNQLGFDVRRITWRRVVDVNDRALRRIVIGLGGTADGVPREDGFDIVVASEVMAIVCLANSIADMRERLGRIVVGYRADNAPILARELQAHGAMAALLKTALAPNLVQTLENNLAFIHGGPFANIAHGCNSVIATRAALELAREVVRLCGEPNGFRFVYEDSATLWDKMQAIATKVYHATDITADTKVRAQIRHLQESGYGHYPVCVAKTQYSFSTDPKLRGAP